MLMFINCVPVQFDTAVQEKVPTIVILDYDITKCWSIFRILCLWDWAVNLW